jgi:putative nucleotidyltransferase with HDIG domain
MASMAALIAVGEWAGIIPLLALAVIAEYLEVRIYEANRAERISFSFTVGVTMAAVTLAPVAAPLVSAVAALVHLWTIRQRQWDKALFNVANPTLAAATAAALYTLLRPESQGFLLGHLGAALLAVMAFHLVNFGMISLMISLHTGRPLWTVVRASSWYAPTKMLLGLTGAFVGADAADLGWLGILMFLAPVLIMRFTLAFHARVSQRTIETLQAAKTEVEQAHEEKEETLRGLILTMASVIDAREPWVLGHSERVAKYAVAIGQVMGLSASELAFVHTGGLLHDLGKVGIPEGILNKPGRLTEEEYAVMKQHAMIGERILADVKPLAAVARIVGEHHERIDGTGYPRGKRGDAISLGGRIVAVADALDAILSHRPYSEARSLAWAMQEMDRCAGAHFDPDVVAALQHLVADKGPDFFEGSSQTGEASRCCDTWMAQLMQAHAA